MKILAVDISALFSQFWEVDSGKGRDFDAPRQSTINAVRRWRAEIDRGDSTVGDGKGTWASIFDLEPVAEHTQPAVAVQS